MANNPLSLKEFLDRKVTEYNQPAFILRDPISVPHRFTQKQDIEIAGFFAAILAWGQRTTIINNVNRLMAWMDESPYAFIRQHQESDLKPFVHFVHRTFNATDLLYFLSVLQSFYQKHDSLEMAFQPKEVTMNMRQRLIYFQTQFFAGEHPERTRKHISTPARNSACKRLNMYLRWMVRRDKQGVDFGLWQKISPAELICPLDIHVSRVAHRLGLIATSKANWVMAEQLTQALRAFDPIDPVQYDFALFGLGAEERVR
jgi:uncharacterized protein (TIGR02757 family)